MHALLLLPILLPIGAGILMAALPALEQPRLRGRVLVAALGANLLSALGVFLAPDLRLEVLPLTDKLPIFFAADPLGRFFVVLCAAMFLLAGIFSLEYMGHEGQERRFYLFYLLALGMLGALGYAGNLMTLYLFFEAMTLLTMPLVLHSMTKEAVAAAFKYLFYSIAGASLALVGFFFVYIYGQTLSFTPGGVFTGGAGEQAGGLLVVTLLVVVGFGAKAGMLPLHAWLPAAHPVAPAPASAVLSGVITKAGVFSIIRFVFYLAGADNIRGSWMQTAWMSLTLLTVFMGSMLALKEPLLKKRLAYSSISQVSYALFGLATLSPGGMTGALLQMVYHSIAKNGLFLAAGAIIYKTGKTAVSQLRGIGKEMPITLWCFTLLGVSLVGIPPSGGFLGKWYLSVGALGAEIGVFSWLGPAVLLLSALLTAGYLFTLSVGAFFPGADHDSTALEKREAGRSMTAPLVILTAAVFLLGMFPGPLLEYFGGIVAGLV